jgi:hypothetical protein
LVPAHYRTFLIKKNDKPTTVLLILLIPVSNSTEKYAMKILAQVALGILLAQSAQAEQQIDGRFGGRSRLEVKLHPNVRLALRFSRTWTG